LRIILTTGYKNYGTTCCRSYLSVLVMIIGFTEASACMILRRFLDGYSNDKHFIL